MIEDTVVCNAPNTYVLVPRPVQRCGARCGVGFGRGVRG